jgi:hypothetical protein
MQRWLRRREGALDLDADIQRQLAGRGARARTMTGRGMEDGEDGDGGGDGEWEREVVVEAIEVEDEQVVGGVKVWWWARGKWSKGADVEVDVMRHVCILSRPGPNWRLFSRAFHDRRRPENRRG